MRRKLGFPVPWTRCHTGQRGRPARRPGQPVRLTSYLTCWFLLAAAGGCSQTTNQPSSPGASVVPVSQPLEREVTDYVDFTGRTDAVDSVGIRARVTGYLESMPFKEGAMVKKGQVLFEIDPRPYQAQLDQARSQVNLNQASYKLAQTTYQRDLPLVKTGAVSQQELDQDNAAVEEALARIKASQASLEVYKLNLAFTKVTSPIDGLVSRYYLTVGNLVIQDQTLLTTVVSVDPMYAYFDLDEPTLLRIRTAINEGRIKVPTDRTNLPVFMGLQNEPGYTHQGTIDFVNNVVNPSTGTIAVRGEFPNPQPANGRRLLSPGMFVRIRLPIGQAHPALLVIDRAIGSDQGLKFVYVVDQENKVQYRRVTTGALQDDGLRVIESGLQKDDWVVTGALLQIRPRMEVQPDRTPMPVLEGVAPSPINNRPQPPPGGGSPPQQPATGANKK
jgi:membrane fusion protein, multidrug efflux system